MGIRKSKFEPYTEEIGKYVVTGLSVEEIAQLIGYHFEDAVDVDSLRRFMKKKGLL